MQIFWRPRAIAVVIDCYTPINSYLGATLTEIARDRQLHVY